MTVKPLRAYFHALIGAPGVVGPNEFFSLFNPVGSGQALIVAGVTVSSFAGSTASTLQQMIVYRTTASSGGTLIGASSVNRFDPLHPNPVGQVRVDNPTVTRSGLALISFPPPITLGSGGNGSTISPPPGASFVIYPGTGVSFGMANGDTDQIWNIQLIWIEVP